MIQQKKKELGMNISDADIETFINRCERLNKEVSAMPELGENYQVGHTFFAEVVDIFKSLKGVQFRSPLFFKPTGKHSLGNQQETNFTGIPGQYGCRF